jgi:hypothetical protein
MAKIKLNVPYSVYVGLKYAQGDKLCPVAPQGFSAWNTQILFTEYSRLMKWGSKSEK